MDFNIPQLRTRRLSSLLDDPSVMDGYRDPQAPSGLLDPAADAIGPPSVLGGLLSLDPTDYIGPQTLGKLAMGLKGLLAGGAMMGGIKSVGKAAEQPAMDALEYAGLHRPPMKGSGAPLHDVTGAGTVYPDDIYGPNGVRYYGPNGGDHPMDYEGMGVINYAHNRPDRQVKMYRSVPYEPTTAEQIAVLEKQMKQYMARNIVPKEWGSSRTSLGDVEGFYKHATSELERLRALPEEAKKKLAINNGDWVTTSRQYAKEHGESSLGGKYKILSKTVPARKLFTNGDSYLEFGYDESGRLLPQFAGATTLGGLLGLEAMRRNQEK